MRFILGFTMAVVEVALLWAIDHHRRKRLGEAQLPPSNWLLFGVAFLPIFGLIQAASFEP